MNDLYQILYTETAIRDMEEKADYISICLQEPALAEKWYWRLQSGITAALSHFPYKYPAVQRGKWADQGMRQFVFRNDVIVYSVNESQCVVYIWAVFTKGKDMSADLADVE